MRDWGHPNCLGKEWRHHLELNPGSINGWELPQNTRVYCRSRANQIP